MLDALKHLGVGVRLGRDIGVGPLDRESVLGPSAILVNDTDDPQSVSEFPARSSARRNPILHEDLAQDAPLTVQAAWTGSPLVSSAWLSMEGLQSRRHERGSKVPRWSLLTHQLVNKHQDKSYGYTPKLMFPAPRRRTLNLPSVVVFLTADPANLAIPVGSISRRVEQFRQ